MKKSFKLICFTLILITPFVFSGNAFAKDKVKLVYVEWACATASSYVMKAVIEQNTDYRVELTPVPAAAMYTALADGNQDAMTAAWFPVTHADYIKKYKNQIVDLGPNMRGAKIGLVVPKYVTINNIEEINKKYKKFDGKIIGIDPGAGVMSTTEKAMNVYRLSKMNLISSSGPMMTATLRDRYKKNKWVVVTGWIPHWMFAKFDLKFLNDPKKVYGAEETINTLVRKGLKKDMPVVYRILDNFEWNAAQIGEVMAMNMENDKPSENAAKWVRNNPDIVKKWLR
ncbi:MAG: glycine/betaine ABC transporter substrate-binding protein [Deltaproteobacteria bacterium]|nr:MAG: glycine/betaine ABC transporter substrate-binding protein [Deltaproteobacteria bacterium]